MSFVKANFYNKKKRTNFHSGMTSEHKQQRMYKAKSCNSCAFFKNTNFKDRFLEQ